MRMNRFYTRLVGDWLDKPSVCLAFGVRWPLDAHYTQALRRAQVVSNICELHKAKQFNAIDPQRFLKTLHTKRITQSLPEALDRFKCLSLVEQGLYGNDYRCLYTHGWFNAPKVAAVFNVKHEQDSKERERKIKGAIYWELGVVSLSQAHPRQFCELIVDKGIGFTLPTDLVQASRGRNET